MYARACVMGSYSESEKASQHRKMPSNAVAALLLSGRDRQRRFPGTTLMMHGAPALGTSVGICASKAALCATGRARTAADTNAVHDRLLQSMRVRFSDSEQWCSPVKPPRSQNYVKPHNARARAK